jgi:signal transduction histidine kinase
VHEAFRALQYVNIAAYIALAVVALRAWRRRRDRTAGWAAAAFGALGLLEILGFIPNHPGNLPERFVGRVELALLVVFPYLLFRFTNVFRRARRDLANVLGGLTVALVIWTFALPSLPQPHEAWPPAFAAYVAVFFIHWVSLSVISSVRLFRAGRHQPSVARTRMWMLGFASAAITVALFAAAFTSSSDTAGVASQLLGIAAVVAFYLGLAPPAFVRLWWRAPEQERVQEALETLLAFAATPRELVERVLEPAASLVGARALAILDTDGSAIGAWNPPYPGWPDPRPAGPSDAEESLERLEIDLPHGTFVVSTSPYAPFFGEEEFNLLRTLGVLTSLALDRVRLFEAEHHARLELERANQVKSRFVALAAHELRTPMTTIYGFVQTLHHRTGDLDDRQREEVWKTLSHQTERMAQLIEQLLDLSRLEADAIEITPTPLPVREVLEEIALAAADDAGAVEIEAPGALVVPADRSALERIVGNLVTNAFRYGAPPVRIRAEQRDSQLAIVVEDAGDGVDPAFLPELFEPFTRSDDARAGAIGSGLGLSIARSYARAHGGTLVYQPGRAHGARFRLVIPAYAVRQDERPAEPVPAA